MEGLPFRASAMDWYYMDQVINRFRSLCERNGLHFDRLVVEMDLRATHNKLPLDLPGLLMASEQDLAHDICGIQDHLNRQTGLLEDCFEPRYALKRTSFKAQLDYQ